MLDILFNKCIYLFVIDLYLIMIIQYYHAHGYNSVKMYHICLCS